MAKIVNFGLDPYISDAKTDPFIPFGADLFLYLNHIGIQIIETNNWSDNKLCLTFGQSTGPKKTICEPNTLHMHGCISVVNFFVFLRLLFLAHLSQRLIGELKGYPWFVRRLSFTISNIFFSETAWPIKAKFNVEPPWVGGTKVCSWHLGHMTKMAAMPIYGKNPSNIFFSRSGRPIFTKFGM